MSADETATQRLQRQGQITHEHKRQHRSNDVQAKNHTREHRAPTRGHRGLRCPHTQHWCAQKRKAKKHPGDGSSVPESTKHTPRLMSLESCRQTATTIPMIQTTHHLRRRHVQDKTNSCSRPQAQCAKARAQKHTHTHTHTRSLRTPRMMQSVWTNQQHDVVPS